MLFNSIEFIVFFIVVTAIFFVLMPRYRAIWILAASCFFYMWFKPAYILILIAVICIDYSVGLYLVRGKRRKTALVTSLIANIGILVLFKYYNFAATNVVGLGASLGFKANLRLLNIILPIGLSFHTFQAMSYTIEVYKRNYKAEGIFLRYAVYVMFYPQLVAGPIERPQHLLPQLNLDKPFNYSNAVYGLQRILWGIFKKMVVGDGIADVVDTIFSHVHDYSGFSLWVGIAAFTTQIFCDFSGYSDIAIGCARIMNVELTENFNAPYFAGSLSDFWRRWHISLSSWFRDYLYFPLGGNRVLLLQWVFNVVIVFALSGLWHGANWTFIAWGLMHGTGLITERLIKSSAPYKTLITKFPRSINGIGYGITLIFVSLAWVLFRSKNIGEAAYIFKHLLISPGNLLSVGYFTTSLHKMEFKMFDVLFYLFGICLMTVVYLGKQRPAWKVFWLRLPTIARWSCYYAVIVLILFFGIYEHREFIYFQF